MQQRPNLPFAWRPSQLQRYRDCSRGRETGVLDSVLLISSRLRQLRSVSYGFVRILYSSRLILLYSNAENHLVHTGTIHVRSNDVIIFPSGFYFRGSSKNRENLHLAKISRYTVLVSTQQLGLFFGIERLHEFLTSSMNIMAAVFIVVTMQGLEVNNYIL